MPDAVIAAIQSSVAAAESAGIVGDSAPVTSSTSVPDTSTTSLETTSDEPSDISTGESADKPVVAVTGDKPVVADTTKPAAAVEEDAFAVEHGLKSKKVDGRDNPIPYSAVRDRIVPNAIKKAETAWTAEKLTPVVAERDQLKQRVEKIGHTEHLLFEKPEQFVEILRTIPGYEGLLVPKGGAAAPVKATATESSVPADDTDLGPKPEPDWKGENGATGYTPEQHEKLLAWRDEKTYRRAVRDAEARLSTRYKPLEDSFKSHADRVKAGRELEQSLDQTLTNASNWPGFSKHSDAILKKLGELPLVDAQGKRIEPAESLKQAYEAVVYPTVTADRDAIRKEILAELAQTPAGTQTTGSVARTADDAAPGGDPIIAAINRAVREAEGRRA